MGYKGITLRINGKSKQYLVHRIICRIYHDEPPCIDSVVNHKDGDKHNNRHATNTGLRHNARPVLQLSIDGEVINRYPSVMDASRQLKLQAPNICKVLKGDRKTTGGFIWRYEK